MRRSHAITAPDVTIINHGSVWTFTPETMIGREYCSTMIHIEPWQWLGPSFAVDHRMAHDLAVRMQHDGINLAGDGF